jgi:hypothetical protein
LAIFGQICQFENEREFLQGRGQKCFKILDEAPFNGQYGKVINEAALAAGSNITSGNNSAMLYPNMK